MDINHLVELGLVEASESPETALETAKAALATLRESVLNAKTVEAAAVEASNDYASMKEKTMLLEAENAELKKQMSSKASASAEHEIEEAIKAGRIAPQDEDAKAFWLSSILADEKAIKVLASLPGKTALSGSTILAGRTEETPQLTGLARVEAAIRAQSQS